ncbi:MAG: Flp pilus assembly protein CpaB [Actinomycetota bacterium]
MFRRRWPASAKLLMATGVLLGTLAFVGMRGYAADLEATRPVVGPLVPVVVAARDLERGTTLDASMIELEEVPAAYAPPGALETPSDAEGRVLAGGVAAGEALTASRMGAPSSGPIAAVVPPGLRAVVVPAGLPAGIVRAGDRVDLLATFGGGRPYTQTVVTAAEVLRVLGPTDTVAGVATGGGAQLVLLVGPEDAERIAYAKTFAQLEVAIAPAPEIATTPPEGTASP